MGIIRAPLPVLLFVGMVSREAGLFEECTKLLSKAYGPLAFRSGITAWDVTDYYQEEMGNGLQRLFVFFDRLIDPASLSGIKLHTNGIEEETARSTPSGMKRRINLDPGYVTEAKVVLASTKDFAHRIYIGDGIYAEVTLQYQKNSREFVTLEHTYPDFRTEQSRLLFKKARERLREQLEGMGKKQT